MAGKRELVVQHPWLMVGCTLGEGGSSNHIALSLFHPMEFTRVIGPIYDPSTSILHFVDISEKKVNPFLYPPYRCLPS